MGQSKRRKMINRSGHHKLVLYIQEVLLVIYFFRLYEYDLYSIRRTNISVYSSGLPQYQKHRWSSNWTLGWKRSPDSWRQRLGQGRLIHPLFDLISRQRRTALLSSVKKPFSLLALLVISVLNESLRSMYDQYDFGYICFRAHVFSKYYAAIGISG